MMLLKGNVSLFLGHRLTDRKKKTSFLIGISVEFIVKKHLILLSDSTTSNFPTFQRFVLLYYYRKCKLASNFRNDVPQVFIVVVKRGSKVGRKLSILAQQFVSQTPNSKHLNLN